jgi:pimeloyl-ACP methyl ester carboxylesterase
MKTLAVIHKRQLWSAIAGMTLIIGLIIFPNELEAQTIIRYNLGMNVDKPVLCAGETATITIERCSPVGANTPGFSYISTESLMHHYEECRWSGCSITRNAEPVISGDGVISSNVVIRKGCSTDPYVQSRIEIKVKPSVSTKYYISWSIDLASSAAPECGFPEDYVYQTQIYADSITIPVVQPNPPILTPPGVTLFQSPFYVGSITATADTFLTNSRGMRWYSSESGTLQHITDHLFYSGKSSDFGINANNIGSYEIYAKKIDNGCVSEISAPARISIIPLSTNPQEPEPPSEPVKLYLIDPQITDMVNSDGTIKTDLSSLSLEDNVQGAVTDGVSKILIVAESEHSVTFSLSEGKNGTLTSLDDQTQTGTQSLTASPDAHGRIAVIYTSPNGFGVAHQDHWRNLTITGTSENEPDNTDSKKIILSPPPVIFVHGMWSEPKVWTKGGFTRTMERNGYLPGDYYLVNYKSHSAKTFKPGDPESAATRGAIQDQIKKALTEYRKMKFAISQVDVVGHSLGGLMARSLSQQQDFVKAENYNHGYFHRLITIGTPHRGSPLGPELWKNQYNYIGMESRPITVADFLRLVDMPIGSCHADFAIQSSGISALAATLPYQTHSISGIYENWDGSGIEFAKHALNILCNFVFFKSLDQVFASRCNADVPLLNDLIVPLSSQVGYITNNTTFYGTGHSLPAFNTETNDRNIQNKVVTLLLTDDQSEFSLGFPAPSAQPLDCFTASQRSDITTSRIDLAIDTAQSSASIMNHRGVIHSQANGTRLALSYHFDSLGTPSKGLFFLKELQEIISVNDIRDTVYLTLPSSSMLTRLTVALLAQDTSGYLFADTSSIAINTGSVLESIRVDTKHLVLDSTIRKIELFVMGYVMVGDSVQIENITPATTGTIYQTANGSSVISITPDGIVTPMSGGIDTIFIQNRGKTAIVTVFVNENFSTAQKFDNKISFSAITNKFTGDPPFALQASASSGDQVNFQIVSGPAMIHNNILHITGAGIVIVQATGSGNSYFEAPAPITRAFLVTRRPVFSFRNFNALLKNYLVELRWQTVQDQNIHHFTIQRSFDGRHFESVATVSAKGGIGENNYDTVQSVANLNHKNLHYRIKATAGNGDSTFSNIQLIEIPYNKDSIHVYPNPSKGIINIHLNNIADIIFHCELYDLSGRLLVNQKLNNIHNQQIKLNTPTTGAYYLVIFGNNNILHKQMIILTN